MERRTVSPIGPGSYRFDYANRGRLTRYCISVKKQYLGIGGNRLKNGPCEQVSEGRVETLETSLRPSHHTSSAEGGLRAYFRDF